MTLLIDTPTLSILTLTFFNLLLFDWQMNDQFALPVNRPRHVSFLQRPPRVVERTPAQIWGEAEAEIRARKAEAKRKTAEFYNNLYHSDGSDSSEEEQIPIPPKKKLRKVRIITRSVKEARERVNMAAEDKNILDEDDIPIADLFGLDDYMYITPAVIEEELDENTTIAQFCDIYETRSQASLMGLDQLSDFGDELLQHTPVGRKKRHGLFKPPPQRVLPRGLPGRITYRPAIDMRTGNEFPPNKRGEVISIGSDGKIYAVGKLEKARELKPKYRNDTFGGWINFGVRYSKKGTKAGVQVFLCHIA